MTAGASWVSPAPVTTLLRCPVSVDVGDVVEHHLGAELLGLLLQLVHQFRALDAVGEAGEVLHLGGVHQCTAGGDRPCEDQGFSPARAA